MKLGIINTDNIDCTYGGVAPIMLNLHSRLAESFELDYIYLPDSWKRLKIPHRILTLVYLSIHRKRLSKCDFILSHIPEGSYIASFGKVPYAHIYHGNNNPMLGSRFKLGRYFAPVFNIFFKRISHTAALKYTVGPTFDDVKKLPNPIHHDVKPVDPEKRSGFIFAGRLEHGKRLDLLLDVYANLPQAVREHNPLYLAGEGTQRQALENQAKQLSISEQVIFLGAMPNAKLIAADSTKKILLMTSMAEGFPTAIAEALTVGVPVVTTNVGDIPRYIIDGVNGRLLPYPFEIKDYVKAIEDVLADYNSYCSEALKSAKVFERDAVADMLIADIKAAIK